MNMLSPFSTNVSYEVVLKRAQIVEMITHKDVIN